MTATPAERPAERIGGWLLAPLAWLLVSLLGTLLVVARFVAVLLTPEMAAVLNGQIAGAPAAVSAAGCRPDRALFQAIAAGQEDLRKPVNNPIRCTVVARIDLSDNRRLLFFRLNND